ncbi:MAG: hypothetical protein D6687_02885 [Acidobacteria bacterium]|nr:MAG: hypothetical protein D6687_02885 [Acidobacteriota bacterium]GIU83112.1 MAG: hypothetical protein KatS3mg006_2176 [Pyrinomonadaceae bacterium]
MTENIRSGEERLKEKIEKRAKSLVMMGLVARNGKRFRVTSPSLRGKQNFYEVWKEENGQIKCNCLEYEEFSIDNPKFRCEHILAVKYFLDAEKAENQENKGSNSKSQKSLIEKPTSNKTSKKVNANESLETEKIHETDEHLRDSETVGFDTFETSDQAEKSSETKAEQPTETITKSNLDTQNLKKEEKAVEEKAQSLKIQEDSASDFEKQVGSMQENHILKASQPAETPPVNEEALRVNEANHEGDTAVRAGNVIKADFTKVLSRLREQVDPSLVKQREGWRDSRGNMHYVDYVEWHTVADILDEKAPNWSHSIREIRQIGNIITVTVAITIDGVTREGIGTGAADSEMGIKKAEHDALKRAAVKFGVARDLYKKESEVIEREGAVVENPKPFGFPADPLAKSVSDLPTSKQFGLIRALGREMGIDVEKECQEVLGCKLNEISKRAASAFITYLQEVQRKQSEQESQPLREAV